MFRTTTTLLFELRIYTFTELTKSNYGPINLCQLKLPSYSSHGCETHDTEDIPLQFMLFGLCSLRWKNY